MQDFARKGYTVTKLGWSHDVFQMAKPDGLFETMLPLVTERNEETSRAMDLRETNVIKLSDD